LLHVPPVTENDNCKIGVHNGCRGPLRINSRLYYRGKTSSCATHPKCLTPWLYPTGIESVLIRIIQTISGHARVHALNVEGSSTPRDRLKKAQDRVQQGGTILRVDEVMHTPMMMVMMDVMRLMKRSSAPLPSRSSRDG
jgi:hypothetical protein